jgi:hypothetical protein
VPAWLCGNQWKVQSSSSAILDNVRETYNANEGMCSLSFDAKVASSITSLDVTLRNVREVKINGGNFQVEVNRSYPLNVRSSPKIIQLDKPTVTADKNSTLPSYTVEVPFNVYPAGRSKEISARPDEKIVLECGNYIESYTSYAPDVRAGSSQRPFIYAVPITFSASQPTEPCVLKGKVDFIYSVDGKTTAFTEQLNAAQVVFPPVQKP